MVDPMPVQNPEALRALAHPLRQRILLQLAVMEHARAADLAEAIDAPANSVSFHLRTLAKAGLIVEAPEHAKDRRDRVWRNAADSYRVEAGDVAGRAILQPVLGWVQELFGRASAGEAPDADGSARTLNLNAFLLTKEEASELGDELLALSERWSDKALAARRTEPDQPREMYQLLNALGPSDPRQTEPVDD